MYIITNSPLHIYIDREYLYNKNVKGEEDEAEEEVEYIEDNNTEREREGEDQIESMA